MYLTKNRKYEKQKYESAIVTRLLDELSSGGNETDTDAFNYGLIYDIKNVSTQTDFNWTSYFCKENKTLETSKDLPSETSFKEQVLKFITRLITKGIHIPSPESITKYIVKYNDMLDVMVHISLFAKKKVSFDTQLSLELYKDIEIPDEYLTLYIRRNTYDDSIMNIIDEISDESVRSIEDKSGWFIVTTDFAKPRL